MSKTNYLTLFSLLLTLSNNVFSEEPIRQDWGSVNMKGSILQGACTIDVDSIDQTVDIGSLTIRQLKSDIQIIHFPFSIKVVNCIFIDSPQSVDKNTYYEIRFDGTSENQLFISNGLASGLGIKIIDSQGNIAKPGHPLRINHSLTKQSKLNYFLRLVGNQRVLRVGDISATIQFHMNYY